MASKLLIMGAAGRDFHTFNCCYRDNPEFDVVAFTATQIPHIDDRRYPAELAGSLYPNGIPILPEESLDDLLSDHDIDEVIFAYSDVHHDYIEQRRNIVAAHGVRFSLFDVDATMLPSTKPVIAITAVRTGCGKSQVARRITDILREKGKNAVVVRHPMPYGNLAKQAVQRFASYEDLDKYECTIEEREEYEPHIKNGVVVYAGADYAAILAKAEREADVVIWDGGNNDTPFYRPDLWIVVADPYRPGHELEYFPGTENFARADVILINKVGHAEEKNIQAVEENARRVNPGAKVLRRESSLQMSNAGLIKGKRVLAIEDGPTTTHGGMPLGAGVLAARLNGAAEIVDPRDCAVGEIADTFRNYPDIGPLLPAMGYGDEQIRDLQETVNAVDCDLVLIATPIDLAQLIDIRHPHMRVEYQLLGHDGGLAESVDQLLHLS